MSLGSKGLWSVKVCKARLGVRLGFGSRLGFRLGLRLGLGSNLDFIHQTISKLFEL